MLGNLFRFSWLAVIFLRLSSLTLLHVAETISLTRSLLLKSLCVSNGVWFSKKIQGVYSTSHCQWVLVTGIPSLYI